eukprot:Hpha_TRINITY_DN11432_c0_g3::TRINITY_DN11432_c0_g3_i1::g.137388::m.137388
MAFLKKLTGSKPPPAPTSGQAIQGLQIQIENIDKKLVALQDNSDKHTHNAKELMKKPTASNKQKALQEMKTKKLYEKQMTNLRAMQDNLFAQKMNLEQSSMTTGIAQAQLDAVRAQKQEQSRLGINGIDKMMDELEEAQQDQQDMVDALTRPMAGAIDADEDELAAELDMLMAEDQEEGVADLAAQLAGPAVPTSNLPEQPQAVKEDGDAAALADLEAALAIA